MEVFSSPRRVLTEWISKNGSILCRNQSPFSPLIALKAFLEIDYTESLPPLWITVAQFQSHFLQSKDMGIYSITLQGAKHGARTSETTPFFLRITLCKDSGTSVWVLGIALLSQISVITLVVPFQDQFSPIKIKMRSSWNLKTTPRGEVIQPVLDYSLLCRFLQTLMITRAIMLAQFRLALCVSTSETGVQCVAARRSGNPKKTK